MPDTLRPPPTDRQLSFYDLLLGARSNWLLPALRQALAHVDLDAVSQEIQAYAAEDARRVLAAAQIRDEYVFPTPALLRVAPKLLGYYRLLLGRPQKSFYGPGDGFGMFRSMERAGSLSPRQEKALPDLCRALSVSLGQLVIGMSATVTAQDIEDLQLLTIGSQFQGSNNNVIGREATRQFFLAILDLIPVDLVLQRSETRVVLRNASGRAVHIELRSDPDVGISEGTEGDEALHTVAIEIKGGTDRSNAHNRAGEAEKSHLTARAKGYQQCWTVISVEGIGVERLRRESPSTNVWFDVQEILARRGPSWDDFRRRLAAALGIPSS